MSKRRDRETILLTVDEIGDRFADVGPTSSVLALARELNGSDESSYLSLYIHRLARTLSPNLPALSTDIRSGDVVRVVLAEPEVGNFLKTEGAEESPSDIQGATLHMLSGPLTGSAYQLAVGDNRVGRVSDNDVVLVDAGVSRHHATVTVGSDGVQITDNQSTNGIRVDGKPITKPTPVQSGQRVLLGRCWVTLTFASAGTPEEVTERELATRSLYLERTPRADMRFAEQTVNLPAPPTTGGRRRRSGGTSDRVAVDQFNIAVGTITGRLDDLQVIEAKTRREESPSIDVLASEIFVDGQPNPQLLWQREAADVDGLDIRLGLATQISRTKVVLPPGGDQELRAKVNELPERYRTVPDVPAVINLREVGSVGVHGSADAARSLTRSMIGQLVAHHGPDQLGILYRCGEDSREWDWLKWLPHTAIVGSHVGVMDSEFVRVVSKFLSSPQAAKDNRQRPPAIVVLMDEPGSLPPALLPRLVQEGPDVGVYSILLGGDTFPYDVSPDTTVRVGVESANLALADGTHIGGITIETTDRQTVLEMSRSMTSVNYRETPELYPVTTDAVPESDALVVGRFELGGTPPPYWPSESDDPAAAPVGDVLASTPEEPAAVDHEIVVANDAPPELEEPDIADTEPVAESEPVVEVAVAPEAEPVAEVGVEPVAEVEVEPVAKVEVEPVAEVEVVPEAEPVAEEDAAESATDTEIEPEPEVVAESESAQAEEAETKTDEQLAEPEATELEAAEPEATESEPAEEPESEVSVAEVEPVEPPQEAEDAVPDEPQVTPPIEEEPDPEPERRPTLREQALLLSALPPAEGDSRLILGTVQVPGRPNPAVFAMNLPRDGSLGLVGPARSGRTSALLSVAAATALLTVDPDQVPIVYYLDVPGELDVLKVLPNAIGASKNDIEGFRSVTADLERLLIDRQAAFDVLGAADLDEYRRLQPGATLRRIVTLIDDIVAFAELMEALQPGRFAALLSALVSDGARLGVHLVFTGNNHGDLGQLLGRQVGRWLTLGDDGPEDAVRPGRAMVGKNEVRFAVVAHSEVNAAVGRIGAKLLADGATPINSPSGPVQAAG